eukprot:TRINITY_DN16051_c0_g1_i1.p1 TRINITY_DN16051_c0_g1~~TRINITY_DN16051_c0_g1_i1.p1  ORF type:complete len:573 (+),score=99.54 TRINITY_DN16051_c0_g1_i1:150-1868(+)
MTLSVQSLGCYAGASASTSSCTPCRLRRLGCLQVPLERFDAAGRVAELAAMLHPGAHPSSFSIKQVGLNGSVWILSCAGRQEGWLLKQVAAQRRFSGVPTEVESCDALLQRFPGLLSDPRLAFPHSVVQLQMHSGEHVGDLLIARQAPGVQLGRYLAELNLQNPVDQQRLERVCSSVGELLADFHTRYQDPVTGEASHHTDFHPSNVLFDERTGALSIVDLEGMGSFGINDDVQKFGALMAKMAGERYAAAFRLRYIALAKPGHSALSRSSRSTAASSTDLVPLYPQSGANQPADLPETCFTTLSSLVVPSTGFQPEKSLTTIAYLLSPGKKLLNPVIEPLGSSGKAWVLEAADQQECWILQLVSCQAGSDSRTVAERCEELAAMRPEVLKDPSVAFPHCVIPLQVNLQCWAHLLVSRSSCRSTLEQYIQKLDLQKSRNQEKLRVVLHKAGEMLAIQKARYSIDKGQARGIEFRPGFALYDETADQIRFANFADEGGDVQKLRSLISRLAGRRMGEEFQQAYNMTHPRRRNRYSGSLRTLSCVADISGSDAESSGSESEPEEDDGRDNCSLM